MSRPSDMTYAGTRRTWMATTMAAACATWLRPLGAQPPGVRREAIVALGSAPGPFDPAVSPSVEQLVVVRPCYQTLVRRRIDSNGVLHYEPDLASSWAFSPDGLRIRFKLRTDCRFADGRVVDSHAVQFSLNRLKALGRGPSSLVSQVLADVAVEDAFTLVWTLRRPTPLALLAASEKGAAIVNPHIASLGTADDMGSQALATRSAGSGPWQLEPIAAKGVWTLTRNQYAPVDLAGHGALRQVQFREIRDPAVRLLALQKGDVDLALSVALTDLPEVQADRRLALRSGPVSAFTNLAMNTAAGPLRALPLRRAVAQAIDPMAIIRHLRDGRASPFLGPLPAGMPGAAPDSVSVRHDPASARAAVLNQGAEGQRLDMIYPGLSVATDTLAQYLQAAITDTGLVVRLQRLSLPAFIDRVGRGSYDLALMGWVVDSPDPASVLNVWLGRDRIGAGGNYARFDDAQTQSWLDSSLTETDPVARARLLEQAARRANAAVPYVYLFQTHNWLVHDAQLMGVDFDPWDLFRLHPEHWSWRAA